MASTNTSKIMKHIACLLFAFASCAHGSFGQNDARPRIRPNATCCAQEPLRHGFTGGNRPGLDASTTASTADVAVIIAMTNVERLPEGTWKFNTAIGNDNGNNCTPADNTRAIVQLPPDCEVLRVSVNRADRGEAQWTQCGAYLEIHLGQLCPADKRIGAPTTIEVILKASPYKSAACLPAFGVFAFSGMPDHVPGNNNWWWREHCTEGTTYAPMEQPMPSKGLR